MQDSFIVQIDSRGVAEIRLNRPKIHNAFDDALIRDLTAELGRLGALDAVRVVVLAAEGASFSAGADLNWMRRMAGYGVEQNLEDARGLAQLMRTLNDLPKPTIAKVQGAAYGGGVGLVAACDIAIAAANASFSLSEVRLGIIPAAIGPYVVNAIGVRAARRYMLSAERFDAAEAHHLGLVHQVVAADALDAAVESMIATLLANGPQAMAAAKDLVAALAPFLSDAIVEDTAQRIARLRASAEGAEGIKAFLEKRKPTWVRG